MVIACPSCGGIYRIHREVDGRGSRVSCPDCRIEFVMYPSQLEVTGERPVIGDEGGISITPTGERIAAPMEVPLDDEPSDAEVLSATAVGEYAPSRARTNPPAPSRIRQIEDELSLVPSSALRTLDHPSIEPDAELIRVRNNQGVDPATLARRLLDEERMVPQERFVPVQDQGSPARWMFAGAAVMALIVICGAIGAIAGGASARSTKVGTPTNLEAVMVTPQPVSAVVADPPPRDPGDEEEVVASPPEAQVEAPLPEEPAPEVPELLEAR